MMLRGLGALVFLVEQDNFYITLITLFFGRNQVRIFFMLSWIWIFDPYNNVFCLIGANELYKKLNSLSFKNSSSHTLNL
jgi:hypothetical protein